MQELAPGTNTGIIIQPPSPKEWIAGGETGIVPEILEPDGNYDLWLPEEESQAVVSNILLLDTAACVTFSGTNDAPETLLNRMRAKGLLPATHEAYLQNDGFISFQNKVNCSDRYTAKMSGTTMKGNSLEAVGESIRILHGLLPERDWPMPDMSDIMGPSQTQERWNRYYADIPQALQTKARKFYDYFEINRHWVILGQSNNDVLRSYLKYGPIQIATEICSPWSSTEGMPPIPACGCAAGHATMVYGSKPDLSIKILDSYKSYKKLLAHDYCIPWAMQYTIKVKPLSTSPVFHYVFNVDLKAGMSSTTEVRNLQRALQTVRRPNGSTYMSVGVFGKYGPQTVAAVKAFQEDNGIFGNGGINFGPQTRKAMNTKLNSM